MEKEKPLTIDLAPTKKRIKDDGRTPTSWSRLRGFPVGTMNRIMCGSYPHCEYPDSEYQKILRALKTDGYLVEQAASKSHQKAA